MFPNSTAPEEEDKQRVNFLWELKEKKIWEASEVRVLPRPIMPFTRLPKGEQVNRSGILLASGSDSWKAMRSCTSFPPEEIFPVTLFSGKIRYSWPRFESFVVSISWVFAAKHGIERRGTIFMEEDGASLDSQSSQTECPPKSSTKLVGESGVP
ncbi:hypothetical protein L6164_012683 [Bauhinia variegata]|uniref:Uncharacterized protein n=1 Tax=Bauhinia variegata TaxID=167791 RepID=A0ACB9PG25_BAUVA|nr:hypothetical protein L6164_012683 [Bauhinia variegata]